MKMMKKLASVALALTMVLCMTATAFAAETKGSITVTNPQMNETYSLYKLLNLAYGGEGVENESVGDEISGSNDPHTYTVNATWAGFFAQEGEGAINGIYVDIDEQGYVTWHEGADAAEFAKKAMEYAEAHDIAPLDTITPTAEDPEVKFEDLELGYYLVDSTLGALCALDSTNYNANIREKNELPTMDKTIAEIENGTVDTTDNKSGTAAYGSTVTFQIVVNVPATAVGIMTVHDTMDEYLTYGALVSGPVTQVEEKEHETCTVEFVISAETVAANLGGKVTIQYTATLDENAPVDTAIKNKAHLSYSKYETPDSETEVYTYEFDLVKTNSDDIQINGAKFDLFKVVNGEDVLVEEGIEAGFATISGLSNGSYKLVETQAPDGYNMLKEPVPFEITNASLKATVENGKYKANAVDDPETEENEAFTNSGIKVVNYTGAELPSTGGIGTTIFYIVGGILVVGAGILLVTKKRVGEED